MKNMSPEGSVVAAQQAKIKVIEGKKDSIKTKIFFQKLDDKNYFSHVCLYLDSNHCVLFLHQKVR